MPKSNTWTTVTPTSRRLALVLLIVLTIGAFIFGIWYGGMLKP